MNRPRNSFAIALLLALACSATALAATSLKGKTYQGGVPSWGTSEGHRIRTHTSGNIMLAVAGNGRSVTVRFSSSSPVLYCVSSERLHVQSTKPASVASNGTFRATIAQRYKAGSGPSAITQVITGRFSGHTVKGTIRTEAGEYCSGSASFTATAH